jgi:glycosyltransferase involved in cell wall biosynthesis
MKKILIVSNAFYPENSPRSHRATELAKELVRQGHAVKVITHGREGTEAYCVSHGIQFKDLGELTWPVPTVKGTGVVRLFWRIITRFSGLLFEYPMIQLIPLVKKALKEENGYDLLISIAVPYPIHWGVAAVRTDKNKIGKIWVADCGDPYMGQENDTFKPPFYFGWFEKKFCRKADYVTVPTVASIKGYYPEFYSKIRVIPQGFRFEDVQLYEGPTTTEKVIFGYGGMFIPGRRDPSEFLRYLNSLDASMNFEFQIYTKTPLLVEPFVTDSKERIRLMPLLERSALLYEMSKMDFVVNFENLGTAQTPSKLIDYVIINKPVLSIKYGNFKPEVVHAFLNRNYKNAIQISDPEQYQIKNVVQKFLNLLCQ